MIHFHLDSDGQHKGKQKYKRLIFFSRYEKDCANVGRLANATLHHYSKSSEHSQNSLGRRSTCTMPRLKTSLNVFESCSSGVLTVTRE